MRDAEVRTPQFEATLIDSVTPAKGTVNDLGMFDPSSYAAQHDNLRSQIDYCARVKLGYGKALSVLNRLINNTPDYEPVIRPYRIDQPSDSPDLLSILLPKSEAQIFADSISVIADLCGLEKVAKVLSEAKVEDIPRLKYVTERVYIGSSVRSLVWVWMLRMFGCFVVWFSWNKVESWMLCIFGCK